MNSIKNEGISTYQTEIIISIAIFFMVIVGNFVATSLFTCFQINFIQSHFFVQIVISFFLFYFLVSLVSNVGDLEYTPPLEKFFYSFICFTIFLIFMRLDFRIMLIVLSLVFFVYFIELNKQFYIDLGPTIQSSSKKKNI